MTRQWSEVLRGLEPYSPQRHPAPCALDLSVTELPPISSTKLRGSVSDAALMADGYPDTRPLTEQVAKVFGTAPERVLITAGADDALLRAFRIAVSPGTNVILTSPTFEMLPRFAQLTGASLTEISWSGNSFPLDDFIAAITPETRLIVIVSPNNPTGCTAEVQEIQALALAASDILIVVDLAYTEFADDDPTRELLQFPNVLITRTFSKACGLAAFRVGYALGSPEAIRQMRTVGLPYPVATVALAAARYVLLEEEAERQQRVERIRESRTRLEAHLATRELEPIPSQANFVATGSTGARWLRDGLAGLGIATRLVTTPEKSWLRISCPQNAVDEKWLFKAIDTVMAPQALLFDLDGVLADVSSSYRQAIIATAARWGIVVTPDDIQRRKGLGNANDDWVVTHDLICAGGASAPLEDVTQEFERLYQGDEATPGLNRLESLLPSFDALSKLAGRYPLAIVTGRPRIDALRFLEGQHLTALFRVVVSREGAPLKPDPAPVLHALQLLDLSRAWMFGDTVDDIRAARAAAVVPLGCIAPGENPSMAGETLFAAGAARVLSSIDELIPWLL